MMMVKGIIVPLKKYPARAILIVTKSVLTNAIIDELAGLPMSLELAKSFQGADEIAKKWIDDNLATGDLKFEWIVTSDEERAKMEAAIENGMDAIYAEYAERGIPNAREIYEALNK